MHDAEFAPVLALAPFVHCIWSFQADAADGAPTRVVPDGRPELVVHFGDPFVEVGADGREHVQPRVLFAGQVTRPLVLRPLGRADVDPLIEAAVERIVRHDGPTDVDRLASEAGLGRRQLGRRFGDAVGVGPALLGAILRFRRGFDVLERDAARPWTDAAHAGGYHDQSHFIREFRRFVGQSPTAFQRSASDFAEALAQPRDDVAIVQAPAAAVS